MNGSALSKQGEFAGNHDIGGIHGSGPVVREPDEPVFHAECTASRWS
jgi:Nitrile hydratase beta subunit